MNLIFDIDIILVDYFDRHKKLIIVNCIIVYMYVGSILSNGKIIFINV